MLLPHDTPIAAEGYARFLPDCLIARHRADPAPPSAAQAEPVCGAVLMADIMGYTALTERYSQRPEGVEQLKAQLNDFFGRLNSILLGYGGDIIGFAGDAVIAVWPGSAADAPVAALRAAQCALEAQRALDRSDLGESLVLRMRMVAAAGDFAITTVGGHGGKWECLVTGAPLARLGAGLAQATPGAVVLDAQLCRLLAGAGEVTPLAEGYVSLQRLRTLTPLPTIELPAVPAAAIAALRSYIAAPVLDQLDAGQADWLAEFRRASTLFVHIHDIDQGADNALATLQAATAAAQAAVAKFDGTFHRVIVDDKGANLLCVWGIPGRAHEDDPARALAAALAIEHALAALGRDCGIGVTTGRVMCGLSGGGRRFEYTVVGDAVNLAARLMMAAERGILCDEVTAIAARAGFVFDAMAPLQVKGRATPLAVLRLRAAAAAAPAVASLAAGPRFLGRREEVAGLREQLTALQGGDGAVTVIEGEPGVGKSQLVAELSRMAAAAGVMFLPGHADAIEHGTTYFAWRGILRRLLAGGAAVADAGDAAAQRRCLEDMLALDAGARAWLPLLNDVLPLGFAENAASRRMGEQARAENTLELLLLVLQRALAGQPVVIVLEDAHWMDSMSWRLAARLRRQAAAVLLVLVTRSGHAPEHDEGRELLTAAAANKLDLATFSRADTAALVCDRLRVAALPEELLALIYARTDGHPLFSEELAYALRDAGYLIVRDGQCLLADGEARAGALNLPATVEGIIASRVDRLDAGEQLTLKVASVLGRGFSAEALRDVHPLAPAAAAIARQLVRFVELDLVHAQVVPIAAGYEFKHVITQEVTYGLLAYAQRRQLHRAAAGWFERAHAADRSAAYAVLAHHWSRAGDAPRAFEYLHKAGEQAYRRYANREAVDFLQEALALEIVPHQRPSREVVAACERLLGFSRLWLGHVERSDPHIRASLALRGYAIPESRLRLIGGIAWQLALAVRNHFLQRRFIARDGGRAAAYAEVVESMIRYSHIAWFRADIPLSFYVSLRCLNLAERAQPSAETALVYAVMTNGAGALPLHGLARRYRDLALATARTLDDPALDSQVLLFVALYEGGIGDWQVCRERVARAEQLSRQVGDIRRAEECLVIAGYVHLHGGDFAAALRCYESAAASARRRGDRQTAGWGLLGMARVAIARGRYAQALAALREAAPAVTDRLGGIEAQGLAALAHLALGAADQAWQAAGAGLRLLREAQPVSFTTLTGTAAVAECLFALWRQAGAGSAVDRPDVILRDARRALGLLRRFARIFPVGRPRWLLQQGHYLHATGAAPRALQCWQHSAEAAAALAMPADEAQAWLALARHGNGAAATVAHARAAALFETLGVAMPDMPVLR
jgi:class 3 adenylate cyclase/tetratricopeptide (TPR) repeat protein